MQSYGFKNFVKKTLIGIIKLNDPVIFSKTIELFFSIPESKKNLPKCIDFKVGTFSSSQSCFTWKFKRHKVYMEISF